MGGSPDPPPPPPERQAMQSPDDQQMKSPWAKRRRGFWASVMTSPQGITGAPSVTGTTGGVTGG